jgi:hypothetical protein
MKKSIIILTGLFCIVFFFQDCKKLKKYTDFDVDYSTDFVIPANGGLIGLPINIVTPETTTNTEGVYDNNDTEAKLVDEVTMTRLNLVINSPQNASFDFLESIEVYLSTSSEPEVLVASKYDIPKSGLRVLELDTRDENLKAYLQENAFKIRVKTNMRQAVAYDISMTANETFHVKAKLKNLFKR